VATIEFLILFAWFSLHLEVVECQCNTDVLVDVVTLVVERTRA